MVVWWLGGWDAGLHRLNPSFLLFIFETLLLSSQTDLELIQAGLKFLILLHSLQ